MTSLSRTRLHAAEGSPPRTSHAISGTVLPAIGWICLFLASVIPTGYLWSQDTGTSRLSVPEKTPDVLPPGIRPDAIIMRNSMGENIFVPRSRYEDFERFLRNETTAAPMTTANEALDQLDIAISIDNNIAKLQVEAKATLLEPNPRWLSIPLGLGLVQVVPTFRPGQTTASFPPVRVANDAPGYFWNVSPGTEPERRIRFDALCNVSTTSQGQSIRLDLPPVPQVLRLQLPIGQWDLNISGTGSEVVEPFRELNSMSVGIVRTSGGPISLSWSKKLVADQIQAIEVESKTTYTTMSESGQFRAVSNLTIRGPKSIGGRLFLITLPADSQWREPAASLIPFQGYRITKSDVSPDSNEPVLRLEFEEAVMRTEIEVAIEWQMMRAVDSNTIAFAIPKVEGVQRHVGILDLSLPRNIKFQWEPQPGIEFSKQTAEGGDWLGYSFRFQQQTQPLIAQWSAGDRVSKLKASYSVVYDEPVLQLFATVEVVDDIRSLPFLQLDVHGWSVDRVQIQPSGRLLDLVSNRSNTPVATSNSLQSSSSIALSLGELLDSAPPPSTAPNPNNGNVDTIPSPDDNVNNSSAATRDDGRAVGQRGFSFLLTKRMDRVDPESADREQIQFALPMLSWIDPETQKRLSVCVAGDLSVQSSSSILTRTNYESASIVPWSGSELSLQNAKSNLTRTPSSNWRSVSKYRVNASEKASEWVGIAQPASTELQARAQTAIAVGDEWIDFSQDWKLIVQGRLPRTLLLAIPKEWGNDPKEFRDSLRISLDGNPVAILPAEDRPTEARGLFSPEIDPRLDWVRLALPSESLVVTQPNSERTIAIRKKWAFERNPSATRIPFDWGLPILAADKWTDSLLIERFSGELRLDSHVRCSLQSPVETSEFSSNIKSPAIIPFDCTLQNPRLLGDLIYKRTDTASEIVVESAWLQSISNAVEQRERFVVRFSTESNTISMILPVDRLTDYKVILNGRKGIAVPNPSTLGRIDIALEPMDINTVSPNDSNSSYVMEIFTWPSTNQQWIRTLHVELPKILNCRQHFPLVWQIMAPATDHLIGTTSSLAPGYRWQWKDLWMQRQSDWSQERLEQQMGATSQPLISQHTNQYVFFALNQNAPMRAWLAPRYLLWGPVALFLLLGSFVVLEFRWIRKPWLAIGLLLTSLAFSQWAWDLSIALAQCLVASVGIAVLYVILKWVVDRRSRRRSVFATRPIPAPVSGATRASTGSSIASANPVASPPMTNLRQETAPENLAVPLRKIVLSDSPSTANLGHSDKDQ